MAEPTNIERGRNDLIAWEAAKPRNYFDSDPNIQRVLRMHLGDAAFDAARLSHDMERSRRITEWAYRQGELAGAHVWIKGNEVSAIQSTWRSALGVEAVRLAAEENADYDPL